MKTTNRTCSFFALIFVFLLVSPIIATQDSDGFYSVRNGDYLSRIASQSGVSISEIRKANSIKGDVIHPGDSLRIPNPMHKISGSKIVWSKPFKGKTGKIERTFGTKSPTKFLKIPYSGTDIRTPVGTKVYSPADGIIRYIGTQEGYGNVMIIEHGGKYASVIGPLASDSHNVKINQIVLRGDKLGVTADPIVGTTPYLHIELRKNNKAINPVRLLR